MNDSSPVRLKALHGQGIADHLDDIAYLRIQVFREWLLQKSVVSAA